MVTKLLFTLLILIGGVFLLRMRAGGRPRYAAPPVIRTPSSGRRIRRIAFGVVGLMALSVAGYGVHYWNDRHRVVQVRVVNTNTGAVTTFRAYQGEVDLTAGRFRTLEGQEVHPATVERLELFPE